MAGSDVKLIQYVQLCVRVLTFKRLKHKHMAKVIENEIPHKNLHYSITWNKTSSKFQIIFITNKLFVNLKKTLIRIKL